MSSGRLGRASARFACATMLGAGALLAGSPAWAGCTTNGTIVVCDSTPPNPEPNGASGSDITVNSGASVAVLDPFAGASPQYETVVVFANGKLTAASGSTITGVPVGTNAVHALANSTLNLSGLVTTASSSGTGVLLGQGATLTLNAGGLIESTAFSSSFNAQGTSGVIRAEGDGTTIIINGSVSTSAFGTAAIRPETVDFFANKHVYASNITVGATGLVVTGGVNAPAIAAPGGSTLTVAGTVRSSTVSLTAVQIEAGPGATTVIDVKASGRIEANGEGAIIGTGAAMNLTNAGLITSRMLAPIAPAFTIALDGTFNDTITNSGSIVGGRLGAISFGPGDDSLVLLDGSSITGLVDGGAGSDTVTLGGTGGALPTLANFEQLVVTGTGWTLGQPLSALGISGPLTVAAGGSLRGNVASLVGLINNNGTLIVDQASDATFAGGLFGTGAFVKAGAGALTMAAQPNFTGGITVAAGRLAINGTQRSPVLVQSGGTFGGNAVVGNLTVATGGTVAPGNSIGQIFVSGNFVQQAGSTYLAETAADGTSDQIIVTGTATIAPGAQLALVAGTGGYAIGTRYVVLTAAGGITGSYTLAPPAGSLVDFRLGSASNGIFVDVTRSKLGLIAVSQTANQAAAAGAVGGLASSNSLYQTLVAVPTDAAVRAALDGLSGEVHATLVSAMVADAGMAQRAVFSHADAAASGLGLWVQGVYRDGKDDGASGIAAAKDDAAGLIGGVDAALGDIVRVGVAGGYTRTRESVAQRASTARVESTHLLAYATASFGGYDLRGSLGYAWVRNKTQRTVSVGAFSDSRSGRYDGTVLHGVAEIGHALPLPLVTIEPFVAVEFYRTSTDAFVETGGAAALSGAARSETYAFSTLGAYLAAPLAPTVSANARLGWRHAIAGRETSAMLNFTGSSPAFQVQGTPLSRDQGTGTVQLVWAPSPGMRLSAGYSGAVGGVGQDHAAHLGASIAF